LPPEMRLRRSTATCCHSLGWKKTVACMHRCAGRGMLQLCCARLDGACCPGLNASSPLPAGIAAGWQPFLRSHPHFSLHGDPDLCVWAQGARNGIGHGLQHRLYIAAAGDCGSPECDKVMCCITI
jgi:hypothetical protein